MEEAPGGAKTATCGAPSPSTPGAPSVDAAIEGGVVADNARKHGGVRSDGCAGTESGDRLRDGMRHRPQKGSARDSGVPIWAIVAVRVPSETFVGKSAAASVTFEIGCKMARDADAKSEIGCEVACATGPRKAQRAIHGPSSGHLRLSAHRLGPSSGILRL